MAGLDGAVRSERRDVPSSGSHVTRPIAHLLTVLFNSDPGGATPACAANTALLHERGRHTAAQAYDAVLDRAHAQSDDVSV